MCILFCEFHRKKLDKWFDFISIYKAFHLVVFYSPFIGRKRAYSFMSLLFLWCKKSKLSWGSVTPAQTVRSLLNSHTHLEIYWSIGAKMCLFSCKSKGWQPLPFMVMCPLVINRITRSPKSGPESPDFGCSRMNYLLLPQGTGNKHDIST